MSTIATDDVLDNLYKLQIRESVRLNYTRWIVQGNNFSEENHKTTGQVTKLSGQK